MRHPREALPLPGAAHSGASLQTDLDQTGGSERGGFTGRGREEALGLCLGAGGGRTPPLLHGGLVRPAEPSNGGLGKSNLKTARSNPHPGRPSAP